MNLPIPVPDGESALHAPPGFFGWVAALVHAHRARLIAYARRRGLDAEDALDAVQDSFVSFSSLPEARGIAHEGEDALKLLTVILRHNLQNCRRKHGRRSRAQALLEVEAAAAEHDDSEQLIARAEELARVRGCILRMAELQRQVISLSLLDGAPRDSIGRLLGISDAYARVLLHRARQHVRSCSFEESTPDTERPL